MYPPADKLVKASANGADVVSKKMQEYVTEKRKTGKKFTVPLTLEGTRKSTRR